MIGEKLYELRRKENFSQEEVAEKLGVSRQTVSKWETNQSQPDLDKIVPICNLFLISTEELLTGKIKEKEEVKKDNKKALVVTISVFLYFLSVIFIILGNGIGIDDSLLVSIFLLIIAIATCILIFYFVGFKKLEKEKTFKEYEKYDNILAILFTIIYFFISFLTRKWQITWIIWLIYALLIEIIHLTLKMKGNK